MCGRELGEGDEKDITECWLSIGAGHDPDSVHLFTAEQKGVERRCRRSVCVMFRCGERSFPSPVRVPLTAMRMTATKGSSSE